MRRSSGEPLTAGDMLFFFELFLFVLVMLTLAIGEFVSRGLALTLWLVVTALTLVGYVFARQSLQSLLAGGAPGPETSPADGGMSAAAAQASEESSADRALGDTDLPEPDRPDGDVQADVDVPTPLDERWARTLLYNWRRANVLLILGAVVTGGWYWLGWSG
ncbi:MAG: hypothetical protein AB7P40_10795 [Chloroflexota bacterium]